MNSRVTKSLELEAQELVNGRVSFLSLVKRGANALPFKLLKADTMEETPMATDLDLKGISLNPPPASAPRMSAVLVTKGESATYEPSLLALGYTIVKVDTETNPEHDIIHLVEGVDTRNAVVLKASDDVGYVVENVKKYFSSYPNDTKFSANINGAMFFPGFRTASDVLVETVWALMDEVESEGAPPTDKIKKALKEYNDYVLTLVAAIPSKCFKMDTLTSTPPAPAEETTIQKEESPMATTTEEHVEKAAAAICPDCKKPGCAGDCTEGKAAKACGGKAKKEEDESTGITPIAADQAVAKADTSLLDAVTALTAMVTTMVTKMDALATRQEAVEANVTATASTVTKSMEKINTTVLGGAGGENISSTPVKKGDDLWEGVLDFK
jgi:hypothetical protein